MLVGLFVLVGCGKVAQEVNPEKKDLLAFNLVYSISVLRNDVLENPATSTANVFTYSDTTLTAEVDSIKIQNNSLKLVEITWGKGLLIADKSQNASANADQKNYYSKAYNKNGVELANSDKTWTFLKFDNNAKKWNIMSNKIKKDASFYLINVTSNKNKYLLKIINANDVSGNETLNVANLTNYDTFLALLFLTDLESNQEKFTKFIDFDDLTKLFNQSFFAELNYQIPAKGLQNLMDNPLDKNSLEQTLLNLYYLYITDPREAIKYAKGIKSNLISQKAIDIVISNIGK